MFTWLMKSKEKERPFPSPSQIPRHVAIIPDGNGRWAKKRGYPRTTGHAAGVKRLREIIRKSGEWGIEILTIYAFSTENWNRPKNEIEYLMNAPLQFLSTDLPKLIAQNVRVQVLGCSEDIPERTWSALSQFEEKTAHCTGLLLNFAFNYGSRSEMLYALRSLVKKVKEETLTIDEIDESVFSNHLYTKNLPDPDLLIRTSGEKRLSNFLLWQCAYTEFWFTDRYWPDFTKDLYAQAMRDYAARERRYGATESIGKGGSC